VAVTGERFAVFLTGLRLAGENALIHHQRRGLNQSTREGRK
jgi:hypothetical protein